MRSSRVVLATLLSASWAVAGEAPEGDAKLDDGVAEMAAGRYATACPLIASSYRSSPRAAVLFTLAECESKWGHRAEAAAHYGEYLRAYGELPADAQRAERGRHEAAATRLEALRHSGDKEPHPADPTTADTRVDGPVPRRVSLLPLAIGSLIVGAAALGVGAAFGVLALDKKGTTDANCPNGQCNHVGSVATDAAKHDALASGVALAAGASFAVAGIVLLIVDRRHGGQASSGRVVPMVGAMPSGGYVGLVAPL